MSYTGVDTSVELGMPVELFAFQQGYQVWYYTSGTETVTYLGVDYVPTPITRSEISQSNEISRAGVSLMFPRDHELAKQFLGQSPELVTSLTIYRGHLTDQDSEFSAYWKGRVVSGSAAGSEVTVECESVFTSLRRSGLRARYQRNCRHTLYSNSCGLDRAAFSVQAVVLSASSFSFTNNASGSQTDGTYAGGIVLLESGAMRFITGHVGSTIYVSRPFLEEFEGQLVELFPGCDHLRTTCQTKFNNLMNFGGFPFIPNTNPFGGTSIV